MIIRNPARERYVIISKVGLEDDRLSWKARGLLAYLLSKPDNWEVLVAHLVKQAPDGKASVRSGLLELRDAGYITSTRSRDDDGQFDGWETQVYEEPPTEVRKTEIGKPDVRKPDTNEDIPLVNNEGETLSVADDGRGSKKSAVEAQFDVAWVAYPRKEARKAALAAFTARARAGVATSDLVDAARNYAGARAGWERDRIMLGSTFFGPNERYVDFLPGGAGLGPTSIHPRVTEADVDAALAFLLDLFSLPPEAVVRPLENVLADRLFDRYSRTQLGRMSERDIRSVLSAMAYGPRGETA